MTDSILSSILRQVLDALNLCERYYWDGLWTGAVTAAVVLLILSSLQRR